ncbi:leucine-rich repeat-containing protein 74A [Phascolarctos cinereus]|uniref:Leucine-rich repeat-containing protein 74A isoform X1 n=1 Tax=Phascolarctos cinereus TaxID=38626 RepID=A0A6P5KAR7_PHACI|nr:leucine-rich repeat-containing protein 74A isoform X1 [Phascolarctos cinereus]
MDYDDDDDDVAERKQDEGDQQAEKSDSDEDIICVVEPPAVIEKDKVQPESYETDLEIEVDSEKTFTTGQEDVYLEACKLVGVIPVSYFIRNMEETHMNLNHHGLGPKGTKAIAIALVSNTTITRLELEDNWILEEGALALMQMLHENYYIQELNISNNHLDSPGAKIITDFLLENTSSLWSIQLAGNNFNDDTAQMFCNALMSNYQIKVLDLSHNEFSEKGGEQLGHMLVLNEGLQTLNLSWNQLNLKGALSLCHSLRVNVTLKILDVSWNAFGNEGAQALGDALKVNSTLSYLDISNNHLNNEGAIKLGKGLELNETLRILKMSQNPMTVEGALSLVLSVKKNTKSRLEEINISNVLVTEEFVKQLDGVFFIHPELDVIYGEVAGTVCKSVKSPLALTVIKAYVKRKNTTVFEFLKSIDHLGTTKMPVAEFRKALTMQTKVPLKRIQIRELIKTLDPYGTGIVDYSVFYEPSEAAPVK